MQKNRMIIGAVALVAIAMVFAGVGYAVTYKGEVSSTGESTEVKDVVLTLGNEEYVGTTHTLQYDTINTAGTVKYYLQTESEFSITYHIHIAAVPTSTASVNLVATPLDLTIAGATIGWTLNGDTWTGTSTSITLTSGAADVTVVMSVTKDPNGTTDVPASVASFGVKFTATAGA